MTVKKQPNNKGKNKEDFLADFLVGMFSGDNFVRRLDQVCEREFQTERKERTIYEQLLSSGGSRLTAQ